LQTVLIIDLFGNGHHPRYIRWIIESEACRRAEVIVAGVRELLEHQELSSISGSFQAHEIIFTPKQEEALGTFSFPFGLLHRQLAVRDIELDVFRQISKRVTVSKVLLPYVDDCLDAIGLLGSPFGQTPWAGITLRPSFHFSRVGVAAPVDRLSFVWEWLFRRALRQPSLGSLCTIDPTMDEFAGTQFPIGEREKLHFIPDPAVEHELEPIEVARAALGIPRDARLLLAYGELSERKGIGLLVECAADPRCPKNIHILLAGRQSQYSRALLEAGSCACLREQKRLHVLNGYQSDEGEARILAASDCAWVGYTGFYNMSGIMLLAARHGMPCLVSPFGLAGYLAKKYELGMVINPEDKETVLAALRCLSDNPARFALAGRRGKSAFQDHTVCRFQEVIDEVLSADLPTVEGALG